MKTFDQYWLKEGIVREMIRRALTGTFDGRPNDTKYFRDCTAYHELTGSALIFTRDTTMHTSGWLKNPDYERCQHLSLSFRDPVTQEWAPFDKTLAREWVDLFFSGETKKLWCEPFGRGTRYESRPGYHYRLFCDEHWQPILPRGEVYSREFTKAGWKSFSELHDDKEDPESLYSWEKSKAEIG